MQRMKLVNGYTCALYLVERLTWLPAFFVTGKIMRLTLTALFTLIGFLCVFLRHRETELARAGKRQPTLLCRRSTLLCKASGLLVMLCIYHYLIFDFSTGKVNAHERRLEVSATSVNKWQFMCSYIVKLWIRPWLSDSRRSQQWLGRGFETCCYCFVHCRKIINSQFWPSKWIQIPHWIKARDISLPGLF